jgi:hypothetical protein
MTTARSGVRTFREAPNQAPLWGLLFLCRMLTLPPAKPVLFWALRRNFLRGVNVTWTIHGVKRMARMTNDAAELPSHMRAVFYRQFAREAECLAHKCPTPETSQSYRHLAELWLALAEQMDAASDSPNVAGLAVHPLHLSASR